MKNSLEYLDKIKIIHFHTKWSLSSKNLVNVTKILSIFYKKKIIFLRVDIEKNKDLIYKFNIKYIPTLIIFKNGIEKYRITKIFCLKMIYKKINEIIFKI
ncbi:thioredoxin family protein [Candidatus Vidania fulgoroideorum]